MPINNLNIAVIPIASHFTGGNVKVHIAGWGHKNFSWTEPVYNPDQLQQLSKITITNDECKERMRGNEHIIPYHKICTTSPRGQGKTIDLICIWNFI